MKKTLALLLGALLLIACKSQHVNDEPAKYDTTMDVNLILEELKGRDVVLFVADQDEISPAEVPFPVVFTGMGKMRMFSALVKWHETLPAGSHPVVLSIGSAGSAKYPKKLIDLSTQYLQAGNALHDAIRDIIKEEGGFINASNNKQVKTDMKALVFNSTTGYSETFPVRGLRVNQKGE